MACKLNCQKCEAIYVGESGRYANQKMIELGFAVEKRYERIHLSKLQSATIGHVFKFEKVEVVATEYVEGPWKNK